MKKILIIEDEPILRDMYITKLKNHEYDAYGAVDGEDGLTQMRSVHPDLILLDLMMPKKTGFQVVTEAKADPQIKDIPIIILTNVLADAKDLIDNGGVLDYIIKSDNAPTEVLNRVNAVFDPNASANTNDNLMGTESYSDMMGKLKR